MSDNKNSLVLLEIGLINGKIITYEKIITKTEHRLSKLNIIREFSLLIRPASMSYQVIVLPEDVKSYSKIIIRKMFDVLNGMKSALHTNEQALNAYNETLLE